MKVLLATFMLLVVAGLLAAPGSAVAAQTRDLPPGLQIPDAARPGPDFDVDRATDAYLNLLTPEQRAQSDAYFEGGYWLQLWGLLYGLVVAAVLLWGGISRRMRDLADAGSAAAVGVHLDLRAVVRAGRFRAEPAVVDLCRLRARTPVRPGHADLRRLVRRCAEGARWSA